MKKPTNFASRILASPILWGGLLSIAFYLPLHKGWVNSPFFWRYFASHPIEYIITVMSFVGLASLITKFGWIRNQQTVLRHSPILGERPKQKVETGLAEAYLATLAGFEKKLGVSTFTDRLRNALRYVKQCRSAEEFDNELRYLSEEDAVKADADYGLVRLVLWAVPMVGFLGTVVGITMALGNLDLNNINESSKMLSAGLYVAFDTTALAIGLDLILYFIQYPIYREENNVLWDLTKKVDDELRGRFEFDIVGQEHGHVLAVRKMIESVTETFGQIVKQQTIIWEQTINAANLRVAKIAEESASILKTSVASAISENVALHARVLSQSEAELAERLQGMVRQFNEAMKQNVTQTLALQDGLARQTEAIQGVVNANLQLVKLEERLNDNLAVLGQVGHFEETVNSLAAAIHLLNGKHLTGTSRLVNIGNTSIGNKGEKNSAA